MRFLKFSRGTLGDLSAAAGNEVERDQSGIRGEKLFYHTHDMNNRVMLD